MNKIIHLTPTELLPLLHKLLRYFLYTYKNMLNKSIQAIFALSPRLSRVHVFFYKKLRFDAGRQFVKFSGHLNTKSSYMFLNFFR